MEPPEPQKKQKLDEETDPFTSESSYSLEQCSFCMLQYPYSLEKCSFCEEACCKNCISDRKWSETRMSWKRQRILFIGRYKDVPSPFYGERLPMDLFKSILLQLTEARPLCKYCAVYCLHLRTTCGSNALKHQCFVCKTICCDECWTDQCIFHYGCDMQSFKGRTGHLLTLICKDCSENFDICRLCNTSKTHDSFTDSIFCRDIPDCKGHKICYDCKEKRR